MGQTSFPTKPRGKKKQNSSPPRAQVGSRASSNTRSSQEQEQALLLAHIFAQMGSGTPLRAPALPQTLLENPRQVILVGCASVSP